MTERLYYNDSYTRQFEGTVLEGATVGDRAAAVLDRTCFYPTSGGQPHDTGRLGPAKVLDVVVRETDQTVLHVLDAALEPGPAQGSIDWSRRFDHMQQHTGQHILSQAFLRAAAAETIGFHLGAEIVSIDLAGPTPDAAVAEAEAIANQVVAGNSAVRAWFPSEAELRALALRKQPAVVGPVRVVSIGDFDLSPCGGTHVAAAGEVGLIAVLRTERLKRGTRVEFLCGDRARIDYARKHALVRDLSAALTCSPAELGDSLTRLRETLQETRRQVSTLQQRELDHEASRRLAEATGHGSLRVVRAAWEARPMDDIKSLTLRLTAHPGVVVLFGVAGAKAQLLFGRSEDLALDLSPSFRSALEALGGGRGGGSRILQGAAGYADLAALDRVLAQAEQDLEVAAG